MRLPSSKLVGKSPIGALHGKMCHANESLTVLRRFFIDRFRDSKAPVQHDKVHFASNHSLGFLFLQCMTYIVQRESR